ncbi:MAG: protein disulfide oxidoreductase [Fidelibacterota bacterium]
MSLFNDEAQKQIKTILDKMEDKVEVIFFTQEFECESCKDAHEFVKEVSELTDKLDFTVYDFVKNQDEVKALGIKQIPAIALADKDGNDTRMRFYGIPGGYEINSFLTSVVEVSGGGEPLEEAVMERIKKIEKDVHIQVFVTMSCPYCPQAVINAHRLALESPKVVADMVEAGTFPHLSNKHNVTGVPKIVINNGAEELVGAQPLEVILDKIEAL